jgi:hypothetical protein
MVFGLAGVGAGEEFLQANDLGRIIRRGFDLFDRAGDVLIARIVAAHLQQGQLNGSHDDDSPVTVSSGGAGGRGKRLREAR